MREDVDRRVLAALRFVDATTGAAIETPLVIAGDRIRVIRNRLDRYVLLEAPGFTAYTAAFRTVPAVAATTIDLVVRDPSGRYLPRPVRVPLPRDLDPAHDATPGSIWAPITARLYPSPTRPIGVGWATLRLRVQRAGTTDGLPFAYVRVERASDNVELATGFADERGEALVPIAGVPVTSWSASPSSSPVTTTVAARVTAYYDRTAYDPAADRYPDPDVFAVAHPPFPHSNPIPFDLASGHAETRRIDVPLP